MIRAVEVIALAEGRAPPCGNYGDVDDDGIVGQSDYDLITAYIFWKNQGWSWDSFYNYYKQYGYNPVPSEEEFMKRADVNGDNIVDDTDATLVYQYINGYIDTFPVCEAAPPEEVTRVSQLKALRVTASCENTGNVDIADPTLYVFVAPMGTFSSESGDPQVDYNNWRQQAEASGAATLKGTFPPISAFEISVDIPGASLSEGLKDVAVVLSVMFQDQERFADSLLATGVVEIVAPAVAAAITGIQFAEVEPQQA